MKEPAEILEEMRQQLGQLPDEIASIVMRPTTGPHPYTQLPPAVTPGADWTSATQQQVIEVGDDDRRRPEPPAFGGNGPAPEPANPFAPSPMTPTEPDRGDFPVAKPAPQVTEPWWHRGNWQPSPGPVAEALPEPFHGLGDTDQPLPGFDSGLGQDLPGFGGDGDSGLDEVLDMLREIRDYAEKIADHDDGREQFGMPDRQQFGMGAPEHEPVGNDYLQFGRRDRSVFEES